MRSSLVQFRCNACNRTETVAGRTLDESLLPERWERYVRYDTATGANTSKVYAIHDYCPECSSTLGHIIADFHFRKRNGFKPANPAY